MLAVFRLLAGSPSLEGVFVLAVLVARWAEFRAREGGRARVRVDTSGAMAVNDGDDADENAVVLLSDGSSEDAAGNATADEDEDAAYAAGGGTDEEVPDGENYFGRAAKEGAAPEGANPFASAPAAEDDWASQIAEAKRQVEEQRVKREKEEALEREKEAAAAELAGKKYVARRKAGDPPPEDDAPSAAAAAPRARRVLKARRPGGAKPEPTSSGPAPPGAFSGFSFLAAEPPAATPKPFDGFSLLSPGATSAPTSPGGLAPVPEKPTDAEKKTIEKPKASILSRLSGAPAPFVEPKEKEHERKQDGEDDDEKSEEKKETPAIKAPAFSGFAGVSAPPVASSTATRTALAVELDL